MKEEQKTSQEKLTMLEREVRMLGTWASNLDLGQQEMVKVVQGVGARVGLLEVDVGALKKKHGGRKV